MRSKRLSLLKFVLIPIGILIVAGGIWYFLKSDVASPGGETSCTMEAKVCPDGSAVGRTGPNCEFAACPTGVSDGGGSTDCNGPGDVCSAGYTCIQKCGPPVARENDPSPGYYCERNDIASKPQMCPICLASNTNIATPRGDMNVKDIVVGTLVWSMNRNGEKIASTVLRVSHSDVPQTHQVVHLVLSDDRDVWVSPNHPTANGQRVSELQLGDIYDGSEIRSVSLVPYWDNATYDILPDSDTGAYWANDVLLGSTLFFSQESLIE